MGNPLLNRSSPKTAGGSHYRNSPQCAQPPEGMFLNAAFFHLTVLTNGLNRDTMKFYSMESKE
jgi:hypothetical protein